MPTIPDAEPRAVTQGETALWQRVLADYPAGTWSLNYVFLGPARITINGTTNGTAHELNVPAATTANWAPGRYSVSARVSDGTTVSAITPRFPTIEILEDPATANIPAADVDVRTWARRTLEAVETALSTLATKTVSVAMVNGTSYTLQDLEALRKFRATLAAEVANEEEASAAAAGVPSRRLVYTRFTTPL